MQGEFDRSLFATVLLALAVLLSLTSVARIPSAPQPRKAAAALHEAAPIGMSDVFMTALR